MLFTPLLMAANNVRIKAVKMLLDFNADISARSKYGCTALRMVSRSGIRLSYSPEIAAAIRRGAGLGALPALRRLCGGRLERAEDRPAAGPEGIEYNNSHPSSMERSEYNS